MLALARIVAPSCLPLFLLLPHAPPEEVVEHHPDGSVRARYEVDDEGVRHGPYVEFHPGGEEAVRATYRNGLLDGPYRSFHPNGEKAQVARYTKGLLSGRFTEFDLEGDEVLDARYRAGVLDGKARVFHGGELLYDVVWDEGVPRELGGEELDLRGVDEVRTTVLELLDPGVPLPGSELPRDLATTPEEEAADPGLTEARETGLRRLAVHRYLAGVNHEGLRLSSESNRAASLAARLGEANGGASYAPVNPGWPAAEFDEAFRAIEHGCLQDVHDVAVALRSWMAEESDADIEVIRYRRMLLYPLSQVFGIGRGRQSQTAFHSADANGPVQPPAIAAVPSAGPHPVEFFGPRHSWTLICPEAVLPELGDLDVELRALDERLVAGPPLELDHLGCAWDILVLRPAAAAIEPGARFLLTVDGLKGPWRKKTYRQVVEFISLEEER